MPAVYDPVRQRMIVIGGSHFPNWLNDAWELSLSGAFVDEADRFGQSVLPS